MAYDFHGGWEDKTGHSSPLYAHPDEVDKELWNNVVSSLTPLSLPAKHANHPMHQNFSIHHWIEKGAAPEKIVLGMGTYGRSFTLQREEKNGLRSPAPQTGMAGPYTREPGSLGYNEICESFASGKWTIVRDPYHMVPYAFRERQWVGYDDEESIGLKALYALKMRLAGAMFWSLETDDFQGICHGRKYPLISTVNRVFSSDTQPEMPTPPPFPEKEEDGSWPEGSTSEKPPSTPDDGSWKPAGGPEVSTASTWWPQSSTTTSSTTTHRPLVPPGPVPVLPTDWWNPSSSTNPPPPPTSTATQTPSTSTTTTTTTTTTTEAPRPASSTQSTRASTDWWESGGRNIPDSPRSQSPDQSTTKATTPSGGWEREGVTESTTAKTPFPGWEREGTDPPPRPSSPSTTTLAPTTKSPSNEPKCTVAGAFRHPADCRRFYRCVDMGTEFRFVMHEYTCPHNTVFDEHSRLCLWAASVPECSNYYSNRAFLKQPVRNEIEGQDGP